MKQIKRLSVLVAFSLLLSGLAIAPTNASPVQAAVGTVVYNLFATDGYIPLADGSAVYNYGFVGGREGAANPLTYQKSVTPGPDRNPETGLATSFTYNGIVTVPDGAPAPTGGLVTAAEAQFQGNAQFPAPLIYATTGQVVEIRLKNLGVTVPTAPNDPHSIHLHGLDVDAANDGVPETSIGAIPANLCADGTTSNDCSANLGPTPGAGNVVVYMFTPKIAGTYMYHCHQEASIHVQMGMYGALIIYNPGDLSSITGPGPNSRGGRLYGWPYDKDYVLLESEIGTPQHVAEEFSGDYNPVNYHPAYWFLNGLSFPNTIHVGLPGSWTDWINSHPGYDPLIVGKVSTPHADRGIPNGDKVLIRMINLGYETQPMHMHGYHGKILGSDQRGWQWANAFQVNSLWPKPTPWGQGLEKQTLTIGSGETYEWLVDFGQQKVTSTYPAKTETRYDPATNLPKPNGQTQFPAIPGPDGPYIAGPVVSGVVGLGGTSQVFPFHNHDDYKATNNGVYPGGMFTALIPVP